MSSLWTPEGEHRIPLQPEPPPASSAPPSRGASTAASQERTDDADSKEEQELRSVARELLSTPVEDVIANHCYGLFELGALHLSQQPANLTAAREAIDAMGFLVEGLGKRLGRHALSLAEGLTQLRLAFVKITEISNEPGEPSGS
ncbi:MAG: hypothetical protein ACYDGN_05390 [Acidimicrobiales bacterium]